MRDLKPNPRAIEHDITDVPDAWIIEAERMRREQDREPSAMPLHVPDRWDEPYPDEAREPTHEAPKGTGGTVIIIDL